MRFPLLFLPVAACLLGCANSQVVVVDVREKLLESARAQDPEFPHDQNVKLTQFSYLGHAEGPDGPIYVVSVRAVLTGMLAPRGRAYTMFFDRDFALLGTIDRDVLDGSRILWCEGGKVFLFGRATGVPENTLGAKNNGNAMDLSHGWDHWDLVDVYEYGSSGGIEDPVPTEETRSKERAGWDDK